ncbi:MAG TPA: alpha/beta hydrolase [Thermoleophilaceae bacterium]|nr:alpha/beta hydrolase [Thermoleophilaceae bacterium]
MRVRLGVLLAVGAALSIGAAEASAALEFCDRASSGRSCARLTVPLDRSGRVPGTVTLRIERQKAKGSARPPLFLIAGGPGQSATDAFDRDTVERYFGTEVRSRDVVVVDMRGTGHSGALDCPALQRGSTESADIAACAAKLGPRRDFYSSVEMAEDIEAVRVALGADRIALYGSSYGTYVAQAYARRHSAHVDRLVLDAVVGPLGVDPFNRASLASIPGVVAKLCGKRSCRSFMRDPQGDAARLAARLDGRPLTGYVVDRRGRRQPARIDGQGLLELMSADGGVSPLAGSEIPGAIRNAVRGDAAPLLRAHAVWVGTPEQNMLREFSAAAYVATLCSDTLLPWGDVTTLTERRAAATTFATSQPAGAFAPFGVNTALRSSVLDVCGAWPAPSPGVATPAFAPLPDVPALLLAGGTDTRTPIDNARAVAAQMPRAKLMTVARAGHGTLSFDFTGCPTRATRRFLAGGDPGHCGPGLLLSRPFPAAPASLRDIPLPGRPRKTAGAVIFTILDASMRTVGELNRISRIVRPEQLFRLVNRPLRAGALRNGRYTMDLNKRLIVFDRASVVPGVRVDGRLRAGKRGFAGVLRMSGPQAARGRLVVRRSVVAGVLGGRRVRLSMGGIAGIMGPAPRSSAALARLVRTAPDHVGLPFGQWSRSLFKHRVPAAGASRYSTSFGD